MPLTGTGREMYTDIRSSGINIPLYCPPRTDVLGDLFDLIEGCVLFYQVLEAFAACN
ncbi:hypothetical protein JW998_11150 [candidate division KSB1 bacterium]|nr:hypothetical protein [candidate division KSB1 bacterium]